MILQNTNVNAISDNDIPISEFAFASYKAMASFITKNNIAFLDAVFTDPLGQWHHYTLDASQCTESVLKKGFPFDGSAIRLWESHNYSDMLMKPEFGTCWIDPFWQKLTLHVICDIKKPSGDPYDRCPRFIAKKAASLLKKLKIASYCLFGPEPEFFIFDYFRSNISNGIIFSRVNTDEASWNNNRASNPSKQNRCRLSSRQMYFPTAPIDTTMELRNQMLLTLKHLGVPIEKHHHEAGVGQVELGLSRGMLVETADNVMSLRYVVRNLAHLSGKSVTFMAKPLLDDAGSGFHIHQSLWVNGTNMFYDATSKTFNLSKIALHYLGGLFKHAFALMAFTNPTTNSYKRFVPGFEAPSKLVYGEANRSAAIRIPAMNSSNPKEKRLECRFPDGTCCPYLAFAALLLAGIDGILNEHEPPSPYSKNVYAQSSADLSLLPSLPSNLSEALDALEKDHGFLVNHQVFSEDFILSFIALKRQEIQMIESIPHPKEFQLYYNA